MVKENLMSNSSGLKVEPQVYDKSHHQTENVQILELPAQ